MTIYMMNKTAGRWVLASVILPAALLMAVPVTAGDKVDEDSTTASTAATETTHRGLWKKKSLSSFYVQGGLADIDMDAMNGRLTRFGFDRIDTPVMSMGFGFNHRFNRFIGGMDWHFFVHNTPEYPDDSLRVEMRNWLWQLNYGADLIQTRSWSVYALGGLGLGHTRIWISEESGESFNGVLQDPGRSTYMAQTSFVLSATLGVDYRIEMRKKAHKTSYFTIGLKGGYLFSPYAGDWRTHAARIQDGPERGFNGPIGLLTLGMSSRRHPPANK
jgi:hypothetical protein